MSGTFRIDGLPEASPDASVPIPPRFWWLTRIALAAVVLLAGLIGLRVWWGRVADQRLQALIDQYQAAGQPVYPEDFDTPHVPDERNAAKALRNAEAAIVLTTEQRKLIDALASDPAAWHEHSDEVRAIVEANTNALDLLARARTMPGVDWDVQIRGPMTNFIPPSLSEQRLLARVSCVAAIHRHFTGDDAGAVATARDMLSQSERVGRLPGMLIEHLTALSVFYVAVNGIEQIAPTLQVSNSTEPEKHGTGPARRSQVQVLIAELLDETSFRDAWCRTLYEERAFQLDLARALAGGEKSLWIRYPPTLGSRLSGLILGPMFMLDAVRMMEYCTEAAEVGRDTGCPAARKRVLERSFVSGPITINDFTRTFSYIQMQSYDHALQLHYRAVLHRRMAATALAIRLYEVDHGSRPARLDELVPQYLPAVPVDPFADDGRPIAYLPHAEHPILYSVGQNGVDEGGSYEALPSGRVNLDEKDDPFFLDGARPRPKAEPAASAPASTQAGPDEQDVENNERQPVDEQHPQQKE